MKIYRIPEKTTMIPVSRQVRLLYGLSAIFISTLLLHIYAFAISSDRNLPLFLLRSLIIMAIVFIIIRYARRALNLWHYYELEVYDTYLVYRNYGVKDRRVDRQEIVAIQLKSPRGGLIIKTKDIKKQIIVPFQLDGFEDVKQSISKWYQIQEVSLTKSNSQSILILALIGFISVLLMTRSDEKQIAIPGLFFICITSLSFLLFIQLSPEEFDMNVRKLSWILLIPVMTLVFRLFAFPAY